MKKYASLFIVAAMLSSGAKAQFGVSDYTLNTRVWTNNYWTDLIYNTIEMTFKALALRNSSQNDSLWVERILPNTDLVFPIGMGRQGFDGAMDIYGPYHYAFGNPFKNLGDFGIGVDASYMPSFAGIYAGLYFKSQEIVFSQTDKNLRGFYFQPRCGILLGSEDCSLEGGIFYDMVTGCGGSVEDTNKKRLLEGFGLDFALSVTLKRLKHKTILQFSMPLHNFLNPDYPGQADMVRKVGYLRVTHRIML